MQGWWRRPWVTATARVTALLAVVAVVVAPLAIAFGLTTTAAHDSIGVSPATLSVSTDGRSRLELGVAGTVYVPRAKGPFGLVVHVDAPTEASALPSGTSDLASLVSPQMLEVYAGLYHHPGRAIDGYVDLLRAELLRSVVIAELALAVVGTGAVLGVRRLLPVRAGLSRPGIRRVAISVLALAVTSAIAVVTVRAADATPAPQTSYPLPVLDDTAAHGATTDSPVLSLLLGDAIPKIQLLTDRQSEASKTYRQTAGGSLAAQSDAMTGPRKGESAVLMQSDMHCNQVMIALQTQVRRLLTEKFGDDVPVAMAISGDLTTNGTAAERDCVRSERRIMGDGPVVAVTGNHETDLSAEQMGDAGMRVLDGSRTTVGDLSFLGAADPERTELFGGAHLRGTDTERSVGKRVRSLADQHQPTFVLLHEAYAAQAFLGIDTSLRSFPEQGGSLTEPSDDGVPDVPASAVFYGHWHRAEPPRVLWNSDGTWTFVMELNTSGGAIATPTFNHFSTPWTPPAQEASFPVIFVDQKTKLVTGYQLYSFAIDGTVTVAPRVDVGSS